MASKKLLLKGTFLHIEQEVIAYHDTKKEIIKIKDDIISRSSGYKMALIDDPTGNAATLLATHKQLEQFIQVTDAIEWALIRLPDERRRLIDLRYWTIPQTLTWDGIADELNVTVRTAFRWRDEFIWSIAKRLGWR